MKASVFISGRKADAPFLQIKEVPRPEFRPGQILIRVIACGVCRTDLHIVEHDLPPILPELIPGHQIVGEVVAGATAALPLGTRVGVSWMGGVDGDCWHCRHEQENLCDRPVFTGYTVNGGYAEYAVVRSDFAYPLPAGLDDQHVAPLLCAGIIGFRSLRVAGVSEGERVGLFGFGSSASLAIAILRSWKCDVYVVTRGEEHRKSAESLGATWVGREDDKPPVNSLRTKLSKIVPKDGKRFTIQYEYDFGDCWEHEILFEGFPPPEKNVRYPLCIEGERACPPEDVGGVPGYEEYLKAISNTKHKRHKEFLGWRGPFDPDKFDAKAATKEMQKGLPDWRKEQRI